MATTTTKKMSELDYNSKLTRYQQLEARKAALEKKLNEKYEQLHEICQKEATIVGNNLDLNITTITPSSSSNATNSAHSTLRKKIDTTYKLPEHLLVNEQIHNQDDVDKLLREKHIQEQISHASLRVASDPMQSKSMRRTHKQTYETSQHKISQLNENLIAIRQRQQQSRMSQDDIDLHKSDNKYVKNVLARNLNVLNLNSAGMSERRNSMKSTTSSLSSSNTFIIQSPPPSSATSLTSLKPNTPRVRHDSCNTNRFDYDFTHKNDSPTPSCSVSLQNPYTVNHQNPASCSQSMKNIKINTDNFSPGGQSFSNASLNQQNTYQQQQQQQIYLMNQATQQMHQAHQLQVTRAIQQQQQQQQQINDNKFIHRLHSFNQHLQQEKHFMAHQELLQQANDEARMRNAPKIIQTTTPLHYSPNHYTPSHSAGLGGYWTVNENNGQRVWCTDSKYPLSPPAVAPNIMSKKSSSLADLEGKQFMHKYDDAHQSDSISISSANSNEHKKKEKTWRETSLDGPDDDEPLRMYKPKIESPTPSSYSVSDYVNNNHQHPHAAYQQTPPSSRISHHPVGSNNHLAMSNQMAQQFHQQQHQNFMQSAHAKPFTSSMQRVPDMNANIRLPPENGFYNPMANIANESRTLNYPNLPPKSKLRHTESTRSTISNRDIENNNLMLSPVQQHLSALQTESPQNVTIIQEGSWKPYKEEVKAYEISDFYKYSQKYRQQQQSANNAS